MKIIKYDNKKDWQDDRRGRITGTKLKNIIVKRGNKKKIGFYELIAERLLIDDLQDLSPMDRGTMLEPEAIDIFRKNEKKKVDDTLQMWMRDDNERIAISPDGVISSTEAVECKCLSSSRHIEAIITDSVPLEYQDQVLQYFIVNDKLKTLYVVFYDPRIAARPYHCITVKREDVKEDVKKYLEYQINEMKEVDMWVEKLRAGTELAF